VTSGGRARRVRQHGVARMTFSLVRSLAVVVALSACQAHGDLRRRPSIPDGRLGYPIGTYLRLEGTRLESGKVGERTLLVDRINGAELSPPIGIWVENLVLPSSLRCRVSGYESGRWIGVPPEVERAEGTAPHQAAWQFQRYFLVTSVQAPDSLVEQFLESTGARQQAAAADGASRAR